MKQWLPVAVLMLCLGSSRGAWASEAAPQIPPANPGPVLDQKLVVGDISISYPTGLEAQAQQVAETCKTVVAPRREQFRAMQRAFSDASRTAHALTQALGCLEDEGTATALIAGVGQLTAPLAPMFTDVRVYREADLKASGGVSNGVFSLTYDPQEAKFQFQMGFARSGPAGSALTQPDELGFLPVVVRDDGTFRAENGLAAHMTAILDDLASSLTLRANLSALAMGGTALLAKRCGLEPFTRWFCEGAAQWAALRVVQEVTPQYVEQYREMMLPEAPAPQARARVNLLAWPLGEDPRPRDAPDEASRYCAYELMERLLRDRPEGALAAIMAKLKDQELPDTEAILSACDAVLGGDSRAVLLEYVPASVRTGLKEGRPAKLRDEGYQALRAGEYAKAAQFLSDALEMTPSDADMRVNAAIAMRRSNLPKRGSERQLRIAAMLAQARGLQDFALQGNADDETWYVLGRIAQTEEQTDKAKALLGKLPAAHADGQAALRELEAPTKPAEETVGKEK
jgi:tetratricopeptide (TPR) repeat protein